MKNLNANKIDKKKKPQDLIVVKSEPKLSDFRYTPSKRLRDVTSMCIIRFLVPLY